MKESRRRDVFRDTVKKGWLEGEAYILIRVINGRQDTVSDVLQHSSLIPEGWQMPSI